MLLGDTQGRLGLVEPLWPTGCFVSACLVWRALTSRQPPSFPATEMEDEDPFTGPSREVVTLPHGTQTFRRIPAPSSSDDLPTVRLFTAYPNRGFELFNPARELREFAAGVFSFAQTDVQFQVTYSNLPSNLPFTIRAKSSPRLTWQTCCYRRARVHVKHCQPRIGLLRHCASSTWTHSRSFMSELFSWTSLIRFY